MNCPTSPCCAKEMATLRGSASGREISGIFSSFLMNLLIDGLFLGAPFSAIKDAKDFVFSSFPCCVEE